MIVGNHTHRDATTELVKKQTEPSLIQQKPRKVSELGYQIENNASLHIFLCFSLTGTMTAKEYRPEHENNNRSTMILPRSANPMITIKTDFCNELIG